jgi:hypothetical protein
VSFDDYLAGDRNRYATQMRATQRHRNPDQHRSTTTTADATPTDRAPVVFTPTNTAEMPDLFDTEALYREQ